MNGKEALTYISVTYRLNRWEERFKHQAYDPNHPTPEHVRLASGLGRKRSQAAACLGFVLPLQIPEKPWHKARLLLESHVICSAIPAQSIESPSCRPGNSHMELIKSVIWQSYEELCSFLDSHVGINEYKGFSFIHLLRSNRRVSYCQMAKEEQPVEEVDRTIPNGTRTGIE